MNLDKYELPNFFVRKKYKNGPGTFNLSGYVYYIKPFHGEHYVSKWQIHSLDFPGMKARISSSGGGGYNKQFIEDNFKPISRLEGWKRSYIITAIFNPEYEDLINEI